MNSLSATMSAEQFDNGYWYASELKRFAKTIGIKGAHRLRKDELEIALRHFFLTGEIQVPARKVTSSSTLPDRDLGLSPDLPIVNYSDTKETKAFIDQIALSVDPMFKNKSGARYRLNRWREEQIEAGRQITYRDLAMCYVELCRKKGRFAQVPHGRYINFLSDFMAANENATHAEARAAWKELKLLNIPKTYIAWAQFTAG